MSELRTALAHWLDNGQYCPRCKSDQIEGGNVETGDGKASQPMSCNACEFDWTDNYKLHWYSQ